MRTTHLVLSGMAFAVWTAAGVVYFAVCENGITGYWWLYGPATALPPFGCLCAWFASRRAEQSTVRWLTVLSVPTLLAGLGMLLVVIADAVAEPPPGRVRPIGMGTGMVGECFWMPTALCGLISFVWAINLLCQPTKRV